MDSRNAIKNIKKDLNWLGIFWENTDRQSLRIDKYNNALNKLFEIGRAYRCYETPEELSLKRKAQLISGKPPVYDRQAMSLTEDDHQKFKREGKLPHWRFKLIDQDVNWTDLIRGNCNYNMKSLSDPVIMREDGRPIYTLATSQTSSEAESNEWPQRVPSQVDIIYPIEATTNFTIQIDDYETKNLFDSLTGIHTDDVSLSISDEDSSEILSFDLSNAHLVSENVISSLGQPLQVNLTYKKYINKTGR